MRPDYDVLLDAQVKAFVARSQSFFSDAEADSGIAARRRSYDRLCADFHRGRPEGVRVRDERQGGVGCRHYEIADSAVTVVYFHGGGWVLGGLDSHDDICAELCARTGYRVISVDYALAPEHVFPRNFEDAWAATQAIAERWPGPLILAGDSAGGTLAAAVAHHARVGLPARVTGQVLIYPCLGLDTDSDSYSMFADAPGLTQADMRYYLAMLCGGDAPPRGDPRLAPLEDGDFSGLPPTLVVTADCDPLSGDGAAYRDALLAAGSPAIWVNEAGLVHGYLRAREMSSRAAASFDRIVGAVAGLGRGDWPVDLPDAP